MTEAEWLAATDPTPMLAFLRYKTSDRKLRLFAVACCRLYWHMLPDPRGKKAVEIAELYADGLVSEEERAEAERQAGQQKACLAFDDDEVTAIEVASSWIAANGTNRFKDTWEISKRCLDSTTGVGKFKRFFITDQPRLLHCIFGNPFRPITLNPEWRTSTVVSLAQSMYESRDFSTMPILSDALQDAGCENEDILNHCRGEGQHVRGCWVVDLVLGKE